MTRITEKKVHTKALHSLLMMKTVTLAMQAEHITNITTPKGKLSIALLVKEELAQVYFKTTHRLVHFRERERERERERKDMSDFQSLCGIPVIKGTCLPSISPDVIFCG